MNENKKRSRTLPAVLVILILGVGVVWGAYRWKNGSNLVKPRMGPVVEAVYGLGTVVAPQTYQVKTAVNQSIKNIFVKEGDSVTTGASLIQFDDSGISRAPFDGTVTSVPFKKGEVLFPGTACLTLVNLNHLNLEISLEQQSVLRVKKGQKATVSFETVRGERINGWVGAVYPRDAQFIVRIDLEKIPFDILPGMTADVAIEVGRKENVLSIPLRAISAGKVSFRRDGKNHKESIQVGVVDGEWAEVLSSNIRPDDEILVRQK